MTGAALTDVLVWVPFTIIFVTLSVVILVEGRGKRKR